jgi:hypothetical protein
MFKTVNTRDEMRCTIYFKLVTKQIQGKIRMNWLWNPSCTSKLVSLTHLFDWGTQGQITSKEKKCVA